MGRADATPQVSAAALRIPTEKLKKSKALAGYNRDLVAAKLKAPSYTLAEAKELLDGVMNKGKEIEAKAAEAAKAPEAAETEVK